MLSFGQICLFFPEDSPIHRLSYTTTIHAYLNTWYDNFIWRSNNLNVCANVQTCKYNSALPFRSCKWRSSWCNNDFTRMYRMYTNWCLTCSHRTVYFASSKSIVRRQYVNHHYVSDTDLNECRNIETFKHTLSNA